ncbi:MAG: DNA mismatch repair protein MutS [Armatimonadetes bacterium]|nr:DNA mismatch repair protein MutS [Armatimonadota bacterium]
MLAQYQKIKAQHPEVLLMFRLGDFYELFGEDAEIASRELEITLTGREVGKPERMPMCGVPYHAVDRYLARLVAKGYRVALCDQVEDAKLAKGLVRRKVTRVVTPGTLLEDSLLPARANNFLVAVAGEGKAFGLAVADISTGEFLATELEGPDAASRLYEELARLDPAEVLLTGGAEGWESEIGAACRARVAPYVSSDIRAKGARETLQDHFGVVSLRGFGLEEKERAVRAAGAVVSYLRETQFAALEHIRALTTYTTESFMALDAATRRHLELTESLATEGKGLSLLSVLDKTMTAMGGRLLRRWIEQPLLDIAEIGRRQRGVGAFAQTHLERAELRSDLKRVGDLERITARAAAGSASPRDLAGLNASLRMLPRIHEGLALLDAVEIESLREALDFLPELADEIERALVEDPPAQAREGGFIRAGYHEDLDRLRSASAGGKDWIAGLEGSERERTGIKSLKVGFNSVFGYYIEVSKPNLPYVPADYIRKQTTAGGERFITPSLKEYEALVLGAEEKITALENELLAGLRAKVAAHSERLLADARVAARLDVLASLAEVAVSQDYTCPEVGDGDALEIVEGRHPVVESALAGQAFVPNDCLLDSDTQRLMILTGPNMSGKSTYLRQVALIVLMAQIGGFVPARQARIGRVDRIFTRIGARDDLASGQSTFLVEMNETANILHNATDRSLVILDEIGRGTSTYDGLSIAWAVAEELLTVGCKALFATHYHYMNDLEKTARGVKNFRVAVKEQEDRIIWLRKVVPGGTDRSYGIQVARLAGLPGAVIARAREILESLERSGAGRMNLSAGGAAAVPVKRGKLQMTLFEVERHPVLDALAGLDLTILTPLEALNVLYDYQKRLKEF